MIMLILTLLIIPSLIGVLIKKLLRFDQFEHVFLFFALGFLVMVGEFALICYPALFCHVPFHIVCHIVYGIYLAEGLIAIIWLLVSRSSKPNTYNKKSLGAQLCYPGFWAMLLLCGMQIARLLFFAPAEIRDSKSYGALIVDILQSDKLFMINPDNGIPLSSYIEMPLKFSLSPWYPFQSMLAGISRQHPLFISNTVLPPFLLLIHYIILFSLGLYLFKSDFKKTCLFMALYAFIQEVTLFCHTPTMIKLVWPVWGKGSLSMTVVPAILVIFMLCTDQDSHTRAFWLYTLLFLLVVSGCSMSTMGAIELPMEIGLLGIISSIRKHSLRTLLYSIVSCVPAVLYLAVYYYLSSLQNLG